MRVAVTYEQGMVGQHFGRTEQFKIYDCENGEVVNTQIIDTNGTGHGALAGFLGEAGAQVLICGGIGMGARNFLAQVGIELLPGVMGEADDAVEHFLKGNLQYDPNTACDHHGHGEGHDCHSGGNHGCHSGGCGTHKCR